MGQRHEQGADEVEGGTTRLWRIIEAHRERAAHGYKEPSLNEVAARLGMSTAALMKWRDGDLKTMPRPESLQAVADLTGVDLPTVRQAAMLDAGYEKVEPLPDGYEIPKANH